ncbi:hypothetical protein [Actinokineospora baliensis]|uniref:hypothetical protein n=1 Tax=Actinokineospora baliensis TaxID=547056 RepID=UPI00195B215F|nr:hypothetical protein [Actinokineospora baliensis]
MGAVPARAVHAAGLLARCSRLSWASGTFWLGRPLTAPPPRSLWSRPTSLAHAAVWHQAGAVRVVGAGSVLAAALASGTYWLR